MRGFRSKDRLDPLYNSTDCLKEMVGWGEKRTTFHLPSSRKGSMSMFPQVYVPPGQTCYVICYIFYVMPYIICHVILCHVTCHAICHVVSCPEREGIEGSHAGHGERGGCFYH